MIVTIAAGILLAFFILRIVRLLPYVVLILAVLYLIGSAHAHCLPSSMVGSQVNEQCEEEQYAAACESAVAVCDKTPGVVGCIHAGLCIKRGWQLTAVQQHKLYWYCLSHTVREVDTGQELAYLAQQCVNMKMFPKDAKDVPRDTPTSRCTEIKDGTKTTYNCPFTKQ